MLFPRIPGNVLREMIGRSVSLIQDTILKIIIEEGNKSQDGSKSEARLIRSKKIRFFLDGFPFLPGLPPGDIGDAPKPRRRQTIAGEEGNLPSDHS